MKVKWYGDPATGKVVDSNEYRGMFNLFCIMGGLGFEWLYHDNFTTDWVILSRGDWC